MKTIITILLMFSISCTFLCCSQASALGTDTDREIIDKTARWVANAVDGYSGKASALADAVFDTPELAGHEYLSSQTMIAALRDAGFDVESPVADIDTAFTASYGNGSPVIGLLAEFDSVSGVSQEAGALEPVCIIDGGNGHGCGHNLCPGNTGTQLADGRTGEIFSRSYGYAVRSESDGSDCHTFYE